MLLRGKRACVTGGTSGLGKEIASAFVGQGASVAILGRHVQRGEEVAESLRRDSPLPDQRIAFIAVDVSNKEEVDRSVAPLIDSWGSIDILVNSAGIARDRLFLKMKEEDWDRVIDTNLKSVYNLCQLFVRPMMKAREGKILNISSVIGLTGNPGQVNYSAAKFGMVGFTKSLARELASRRICVNCIAPGFFETPMTAGLSDAQRRAILERVPMGRLGDPRDISGAALFLASSMSDYVTGQVIVVDGGMLA